MAEIHIGMGIESAPCASDITDPINMLMFPRYACRLTPATLSGLLIALCSGFGSVQAKYSYDIATKYDIGDSDSPRYELIGTVSNTSIRLHAPGLLIQLPRDPVFINVACFPPDVVHPHDLALIVKFLNEVTTVHGRVDVLRARLWVWDNLATRYPVENQRLLVTAQIIGMKAAILAMGLALPLSQSTGRPVLHDGESSMCGLCNYWCDNAGRYPVRRFNGCNHLVHLECVRSAPRRWNPLGKYSRVKRACPSCQRNVPPPHEERPSGGLHAITLDEIPDADVDLVVESWTDYVETYWP